MEHDPDTEQYFSVITTSYKSGDSFCVVFILVDPETMIVNTKFISVKAVGCSDIIQFLKETWGLTGNKPALPIPGILQLAPISLPAGYALAIMQEFARQEIEILVTFPVNYPKAVVLGWGPIAHALGITIKAKNMTNSYLYEMEKLIADVTEQYNREMAAMTGESKPDA